MKILFNAGLVFYLVGIFIHQWLKANMVVRSPKSTINSYTLYIRHFLPVLVARLFAAMLFFMVWSGGVDLGFIPARAEFSSPLVAAAVAGFIGLGMDSILDKLTQKWSWLQGQIPPEPSLPEDKQ